MPSLSNIPGFTALSTSPDPHAAWPAQVSSYNVPGDGTTPLTNPTTSDGKKTAYVGQRTIAIARGNNSGNVKGCNTIACYGVWHGNSKASTGWPNNYQRDQYNKVDRLYIFTVNTSTGAISLTHEDERMNVSQNRGWGTGADNARLQYFTTPGTGSLVNFGYSQFDNGWQWNNIPAGRSNFTNMKMNTSGTGTLWSNSSTETPLTYEDWRCSHLPKQSGSNTDTHYFGQYDTSNNASFKMGNITSSGGYSRSTVWSSLYGWMWYNTHIWNTQPDGATGGTGDICSIIWGGSSTAYKMLQGDCAGNGGVNTGVKQFSPSMTDWNNGNYRNILDTYGNSAMFQKSGSTFGAWRHCGDNSIRPISNIQTAIWDITPKSWVVPANLFNPKNANSIAGIENDTWVGGSNSGTPFYYYNSNQDGLPFVKWEIDDTNGVKVVGSVMPPKFEYSGNAALGSRNNPETNNQKQHIFPIWANSSDTDPSWVVVVFWNGGGDEYSDGTDKGIPGQSQPVLRCYPWPTFTSQNISL